MDNIIKEIAKIILIEDYKERLSDTHKLIDEITINVKNNSFSDIESLSSIIIFISVYLEKDNEFLSKQDAGKILIKLESLLYIIHGTELYPVLLWCKTCKKEINKPVVDKPKDGFKNLPFDELICPSCGNSSCLEPPHN